MRTWILAARPKTLTISVAPILMGGALAFYFGHFDGLSFAAAFVAAALIQIGTNFANDYFDFLKGADTPNRLGPMRVTQAGLVTLSQMRVAMSLVFSLACVIGLFLVSRGSWPALLIGTTSILSGIAYTAGPMPLAYLGLGDLFVIVFFGPIAVAGTYYVQALQWNEAAIFAGLAPGFIGAAVLAINNLRDRPQDVLVNKKTLAVRFGENFARWEYAACWIVAAIVPMMLVIIFDFPAQILGTCTVSLLALPLIKKVWHFQDRRELNDVLANTGKIILIYALVFSILLLL